ncbi:hypothetical protein ES703_62745 [subsurface metagenome]
MLIPGSITPDADPHIGNIFLHTLTGKSELCLIFHITPGISIELVKIGLGHGNINTRYTRIIIYKSSFRVVHLGIQHPVPQQTKQNHPGLPDPFQHINHI